MNIDNIKTVYEYDINFEVGPRIAVQFFREQLSKQIREIWNNHKVFIQELEFDAWHLRATARDKESLIRAVVAMEEWLNIENKLRPL